MCRDLWKDRGSVNSLLIHIFQRTHSSPASGRRRGRYSPRQKSALASLVRWTEDTVGILLAPAARSLSLGIWIPSFYYNTALTKCTCHLRPSYSFPIRAATTTVTIFPPAPSSPITFITTLTPAATATARAPLLAIGTTVATAAACGLLRNIGKTMTIVRVHLGILLVYGRHKQQSPWTRKMCSRKTNDMALL